MIDFRTRPDDYRHWRLSIDGSVATLALDVDEKGGIAGDYALKLNSYDLGVDIELADAIQRLRFEHPEVRAVDVYRPDHATVTISGEGALDGLDVLPGFSCPLEAVFGPQSDAPTTA